MHKYTPLLIVLITILATIPMANGYEIDEISTVTEVIDGDSFYIVNDEVRIADVSAPEWNETGGSEATKLMTELIDGKQVFLDTDDKSGRDRYGRLIAVVYVELNETHYLNVNYFLLYSDVYELTDYTNNEWNPYEWNLVERYATVEPEPLIKPPPDESLNESAVWREPRSSNETVTVQEDSETGSDDTVLVPDGDPVDTQTWIPGYQPILIVVGLIVWRVLTRMVHGSV